MDIEDFWILSLPLFLDTLPSTTPPRMYVRLAFRPGRSPGQRAVQVHRAGVTEDRKSRQ